MEILGFFLFSCVFSLISRKRFGATNRDIFETATGSALGELIEEMLEAIIMRVSSPFVERQKRKVLRKKMVPDVILKLRKLMENEDVWPALVAFFQENPPSGKAGEKHAKRLAQVSQIDIEKILIITEQLQSPNLSKEEEKNLERTKAAMSKAAKKRLHAILGDLLKEAEDLIKSSIGRPNTEKILARVYPNAEKDASYDKVRESLRELFDGVESAVYESFYQGLSEGERSFAKVLQEMVHVEIQACQHYERGISVEGEGAAALSTHPYTFKLFKRECPECHATGVDVVLQKETLFCKCCDTSYDLIRCLDDGKVQSLINGAVKTLQEKICEGNTQVAAHVDELGADIRAMAAVTVKKEYFESFSGMVSERLSDLKSAAKQGEKELLSAVGDMHAEALERIDDGNQDILDMLEKINERLTSLSAGSGAEVTVEALRVALHTQTESLNVDLANILSRLSLLNDGMEEVAASVKSLHAMIREIPGLIADQRYKGQADNDQVIALMERTFAEIREQVERAPLTPKRHCPICGRDAAVDESGYCLSCDSFPDAIVTEREIHFDGIQVEAQGPCKMARGSTVLRVRLDRAAVRALKGRTSFREVLTCEGEVNTAVFFFEGGEAVDADMLKKLFDAFCKDRSPLLVVGGAYRVDAVAGYKKRKGQDASFTKTDRKIPVKTGRTLI